MANRGIRKPASRFGFLLPRLVISDGDTTPQDVPFHLYPSAAPTATAVEGDMYFDSTRNALMAHSGGGYTQVGQLVIPKVAAATLTAADSGAVCVFNNATGFTYTLPAAEAGLRFTFVVQTTVTSGVARVACASGDFLLGTILQIIDTSFAPTARDANGTTHLAWEGDGSTTGGIKGDFFHVQAINASQWQIWGINTATGSEATPFKTS